MLCFILHKRTINNSIIPIFFGKTSNLTIEEFGAIFFIRTPKRLAYAFN